MNRSTSSRNPAASRGSRARRIAAVSATGALLASAALAPSASAGVQQTIARAADGGAPNAPVESVVISRDARDAKWVAFTSAATNVNGAVDGHKNIYLVSRQSGFGALGTPWQIGGTKLATTGMGGAPANGDSYAPALDGSTNADTPIAPKCLAFVSTASNLVPGDTNGKADVFVRTLSTGAIKRIQTKGPATEVAVSGRCDIISWVSGGQAYVQANSKTIRMKPKRISGSGGAKHLSVSEERLKGFVVVFEANGKVRASRKGKGARTVVGGSAPSQDQYGRYVTYDRGGKLFQANLSGSPKERGAVRSGRGDAGHDASSTAGGQHVFYAQGDSVFRNVTKKPEGTCPAGQQAQHPSTSSRGNYVVFTCSGGGAILNYVGGK